MIPSGDERTNKKLTLCLQAWYLHVKLDWVMLMFKDYCSTNCIGINI